MIARDVARGNGPRSLLVQTYFGDVARMHADRDRFQIEEDVDHVLLDPFDRRIFVQHALDFDLSNRGAGQR